jgi:large subunit ribosomal protein L9
MKVILLEKVNGIGEKYEVKTVKDGYGANFLIPNGLAKIATEQALMDLEDMRAQEANMQEQELHVAEGVAGELDGLEVIFKVKLGDEGQLFESINKAKIAKRLEEDGFTVKKSQIVLEGPIKETGEFSIKINLEHNLETNITLIIEGEEKE